MRSKGDNTEMIFNDKADEVVGELLSRYQIGLGTSMKCSEFFFECANLLHYKCHKINPNRGGSYLDPPSWTKKQKAAKNLINKKDNKYFQYAATVALNPEKLVGHPK